MTREEAINIIVKSLKTCNNKELGNAYMEAVDCSVCPIDTLECVNSDYICSHLIENKLNEEEQHAQESK